MLSYIKIINIVKINILNKNKSFVLKKSKKTSQILKILLKYNILLGYTITTDYTTIFINPYYQYFNIKNIWKSTRLYTLKYQNILKLLNRKTTSIYIFSTSKGFLTLSECIDLKIGGILAFKI